MSTWNIELFYDGDCPLCLREVRMMQWLDRGRGRVLFTDIASPSFDPATTGKSWEQLMDRIHARLPDGTMIEGVDVFRRVYAALGFERLAAMSRWPGISALLDLGYERFAKNRLRLTGRCTYGPNGECLLPSRA